MTTADPPLLRGKYRVLELIGRGGMAVVHAGVNVLTERRVAIKRLLPVYAPDTRMVERFKREARAAGRIKSRHVVEVLDIDSHEGEPFIIMERLLGESLQTRLARLGRLPLPDAINVTAQILAGISAAHRSGVVHRDLKPGNVFFEGHEDGGETVKILDFGISTIRDEKLGEISGRTGAMGTLPYMAPEHFKPGNEVTHQTDLWAIGVVFYCCLTGDEPFNGKDKISLLTQIVEQPFKSLDLPDLDSEKRAVLHSFLERALAKQLDARFGTADEMRAELEQVTSALGIAIAETGPRSSVHLPRTRRTPVNRAFLGAAVVAIACGGGLGVASAHLGEGSPRVAVDVEPATAEVTVGGEKMLSPAQIVVRPGERVTATISAPGYVSRSIELPSRGGHLLVTLGVVPPPPPPNASPVAVAAPAETIELPDVRPRPKQPPPRAATTPSPRATVQKSSTPRPIVRPSY